jgi:hypothetical protein
MAIILKANKVNLFVSSVLFVFWYHSPNFLDTPRTTAHNSHQICVRVVPPEDGQVMPETYRDFEA